MSSNDFLGVFKGQNRALTILVTKYGKSLADQSGRVYPIIGPVPICVEGTYATSVKYLLYSGMFGVTRRTKVMQSIMTDYLNTVLLKIDTTLSPEEVCDILRTYC
jgi:hypothetical protein